MRGHVVKRGKDSYSIVLSLGTDPVTGKRKRQWLAVKGTKKEAEKRRDELLHQLDTGSFIEPTKTTLAIYLERWLDDYVRANLSARTAEGYEYIFHNHVIPALGSLTLAQLKPEHLQDYYSGRLAGGLSAMSVRHHHAVIHKALQTGVKWGLLNRNVADAVELPRPKRVEMQTWDEDEMRVFLKAAQSNRLYGLFYLSLFTGMRRSELLGLKWSDVDLLLGQVSVNRAFHHLHDGRNIFTQPKTAKSRRTIALPPSATLVLKAHRERQTAERLMLGSSVTNDSLVFSALNGGPLSPDAVSSAWSKTASRAGVKHIRLHDARHTHASILLKQGVHPKIAQERLGHSTIAITLDLYSHVVPGLQEAAALRFDQVVAAGRNERENQTVERLG